MFSTFFFRSILFFFSKENIENWNPENDVVLFGSELLAICFFFKFNKIPNRRNRRTHKKGQFSYLVGIEK